MSQGFSRRQILAAGTALAAAAAVPPFVRPAFAAASKRREYHLKPAPTRIHMVGQANPETTVWAFNGRVPGPQIRLQQGEAARITVDNGLDEATTVHWHGLRIANAMDGVPDLTQPPIEAGGRFIYEFTPPDAGTYWYHPHVRSTVQVGRGLYGPLIVDEAEPPQVDRDITWVIDDWRLDREAAIAEPFGHPMDLSHAGRIGNVVTVNGVQPDGLSVRSGERIRLRLINTANARLFALNFGDLDPHVIALDGQPVDPYRPDGGRVVLGSGQRVDLMLDCGGDPGHTVTVIDDYYPRRAYTFNEIIYEAGKPLRTSPLDASLRLPGNPRQKLDLANAQRHPVEISGGAMGNMQSAVFKGQTLGPRELMQAGKIWALNGIAADSMTMEPMLTLPQGRTCILSMRNDTAWPHPMHLHGFAFRLLNIDGMPVPRETWLDTVVVEPRQELEVAFVADNPGGWLFHCHILEHHQAGMAAVVRVT